MINNKILDKILEDTVDFIKKKNYMQVVPKLLIGTFLCDSSILDLLDGLESGYIAT